LKNSNFQNPIDKNHQHLNATHLGTVKLKNVKIASCRQQQKQLELKPRQPHLTKAKLSPYHISNTKKQKLTTPKQNKLKKKKSGFDFIVTFCDIYRTQREERVPKIGGFGTVSTRDVVF